MPNGQETRHDPEKGLTDDAEEKRFQRNIKKWDIFIKFLGGVVVTFLIWHLGSRAEDSRQRLAEENNNFRLVIAENNRNTTFLKEFTAKQKELDVNLGMQMFKTLLSDYFLKVEGKDKKEQTGKQLLLLRLIALNFQDVPINLKPLFEELDRQLTSPEDRVKLRDIALELARRQAYRLTFESGEDSGDVPVTKGQEVQQKNLLFTLVINRIDRDGLNASLRYRDKKFGPFTISFFDMPLVDNIKVGPWRVSVVLMGIDEQKATVRLIVFPSYLAADRFDVKELSQDQYQSPLDKKR